jgi:hypothetical protein
MKIMRDMDTHRREANDCILLDTAGSAGETVTSILRVSRTIEINDQDVRESVEGAPRLGVGMTVTRGRHANTRTTKDHLIDQVARAKIMKRNGVTAKVIVHPGRVPRLVTNTENGKGGVRKPHLLLDITLLVRNAFPVAQNHWINHDPNPLRSHTAYLV